MTGHNRAALVPDARIPPAIQAGLARYVVHGIRAGDCLHAILCGELYDAFARADPETIAAMPAIVGYIVERIPRTLWGSARAVENYLAHASADAAIYRGTPP